MKQYKPKEFSEMLLNVSVKTLRRWDNQGALIAYRNPKGRRYYTEEQYKEYMGIQEELVQDLISIIHVFSCRIYGLRKYKKKMSEDEDL
ncbi:MerR family DNA-binding transcriptional regulator [Bacillus cereus group sp. BY6-1LC]|uniref:MerR family DNA-binding transcriptional regulator n=1 Tax=Bacillus cereus group sp. BY6-1LC TaxID=3018077 RepID=UPI0022E4EAF9|nr:MerR family DNA-binding transcriptional regulator [Bacillus cereus group sp. BY6-1LC]MDA1802769.1 MerR family DNA-binding transcriptional regulator [Bacillus cereus group sp. BY6-1LC]